MDIFTALGQGLARPQTGTGAGTPPGIGEGGPDAARGEGFAEDLARLANRSEGEGATPSTGATTPPPLADGREAPLGRAGEGGGETPAIPAPLAASLPVGALAGAGPGARAAAAGSPKVALPAERAGSGTPAPNTAVAPAVIAGAQRGVVSPAELGQPLPQAPPMTETMAGETARRSPPPAAGMQLSPSVADAAPSSSRALMGGAPVPPKTGSVDPRAAVQGGDGATETLAGLTRRAAGSAAKPANGPLASGALARAGADAAVAHASPSGAPVAAGASPSRGPAGGLVAVGLRKYRDEAVTPPAPRVARPDAPGSAVVAAESHRAHPEGQAPVARGGDPSAAGRTAGVPAPGAAIEARTVLRPPPASGTVARGSDGAAYGSGQDGSAPRAAVSDAVAAAGAPAAPLRPGAPERSAPAVGPAPRDPAAPGGPGDHASPRPEPPAREARALPEPGLQPPRHGHPAPASPAAPVGYGTQTAGAVETPEPRPAELRTVRSDFSGGETRAGQSGTQGTAGAATAPAPASAPSAPQSGAALPASTEAARAVMPQITAAIRSTGGGASIELRLDPPELGRVRIDLDIADSGLRASLVAERAATGDLLRSHAGILAQQLQDAGFTEIDLQFGAPHGEGGRGGGDDGRAGPHGAPGRDAPPEAGPGALDPLPDAADGIDLKF